MSQLGRRPFSMAMVGFAVSAVFVSYQLLRDSESPIGLWLAFDPEVGTNRFFALWSVIARMSAGWVRRNPRTPVEPTRTPD